MRMFPRAAAAAVAALALSGCALLIHPPAPQSQDARLSAFPTKDLPLAQGVTIRWDEHKIPFIEAKTDADAAFAMGMVHAHLRLGQMAALRLLVEGRLSEAAGPFATELDAAIRAFDFDRATPAVYAAMPAETRLWLDRYADGVNAYADRLGAEQLPHEFEVLGIEWERWRPEDSVTIGRATGLDINWGAMLTLLTLEDAALRERVFERLTGQAASGASTFPDRPSAARAPDAAALTRLAELTAVFGKSGSNSFVVSPERSATGAAMIANDPHLGFLIPNAWLIAGLRSPSYAVVGMMLPGTPVFGFGRNESLAWGGTNLRATISQLVDVSALPEDAFEEDMTRIGVRFWLDADRTSRRTAYGPVLSELDPLPTADRGVPFAVRWIGHEVSDEFTALLGAMRAPDVRAFRRAMESFAVPPQTFLVADRAGAIAGVIATRVPVRAPGDGPRLLTDPAQSDREWAAFYDAGDLPAVFDPAEGYLASSNNRPTDDDRKPYAGFFPQDERVRRLQALLEADASVTLDEMKAIQQDLLSPLSLELLATLRPALDRRATEVESEREVIAALQAWDGRYAIDSQGALLFEALLTSLAPATYEQLGREDELEIYKTLSLTRKFLVEDWAALTADAADAVIGQAVERMMSAYESGRRWGDVHQLRVQHIFGTLPLIGDRYLIETIPMPGSRETVLKSAHELTDEPHIAFFGAQSRHISDLSDLDANFFVLLGGQDGWINSANFSDQTALWREGRYIRTPLSPQGVRERFPTAMRLEAAAP